MRRYRFLAFVALLALLGTTLASYEVAVSGPQGHVAAQEAAEPLVFLSGLQLPDSVRYSVNLVKPVDLDPLVEILKNVGVYWLVLNQKPDPQQV